MLSINQLAWVANVLVSTVSGRAVGVRRPAIRCEEGQRVFGAIVGFREADGFLWAVLRGRKLRGWLMGWVPFSGKRHVSQDLWGNFNDFFPSLFLTLV